MKTRRLTINNRQAQVLLNELFRSAALALICALDERINCRRVGRSTVSLQAAASWEARARDILRDIDIALRCEQRPAIRARLMAEVRAITRLNPNGIVVERRPAVRAMKEAA